MGIQAGQSKIQKLSIATVIVRAIQNGTNGSLPGRFLREDTTKTGKWYTISYEKAIAKTYKALLEKRSAYSPLSKKTYHDTLADVFVATTTTTHTAVETTAARVVI